MKKDKALRWPYGIALSFIGIIALIYFTIYETMKYPVEASDMNMLNYHQYDKNANDIIMQKIAFDKEYTLNFISDTIKTDETQIKYRLTDKAGNPVNSAKIRAVVTRPNEHKYDIKLENPTVKDGVYTFEKITLPKEGRWNIIASVEVDSKKRFLNLKADTRYPKTFEY